MKEIIGKHKQLWPRKDFHLSVGLGSVFLVIAMFSNYAANIFVTNRASNYVSDLILDNLPVVNVDFVFIEVFVFFWLVAMFFLFKEPKKLPFVLKCLAVFILIRSIFISLTHLAIPPDHSFVDPARYIQNMTSGNDLFFSVHTGLPYLAALFFWENKRLRYFFIACSVLFGFSVLLGHLHYSIDVFAAFFITYGIFHMAQRIFFKDYKLFLSE